MLLLTMCTNATSSSNSPTVNSAPTRTPRADSSAGAQPTMTVREFAYATRAEYERELRADGSFTEEEIQRNLAAMPAQQTRLQRWFAREDHYDNVESFEDHVYRIIADNVVTSAEQAFICEVSPQWTDQLQAARTYALDYERDDPEGARQNGIDAF